MVKIRITEAPNVRSSLWKSREVSWEILKEKVINPTILSIGYDSLMSMDKEQKAQYKDTDCFVGGYFSGDRRKKQDVIARTLITLDIESLDGDAKWTIDDVKKALNDIGCEAILYTTVSHSAENPRCRVLLSVDREMKPEEYEPVARKIGEMIGLEKVDHTTFDTNRAMYYPTLTYDGDYDFLFVDGPSVCVDDILGMYQDWTDSKEWPRHELEKEAGIREYRGEKQEDPLKKENLIGDFCRAYSITEAIEGFDLPYDISGNRATYRYGTSALGCEIFEDKWMYSYHATDPISGMLCNAYDLVRINLFGDDDKSYAEMTEMISEDPEVMEEHRKREAEKFKTEKEAAEYWDWENELSVKRSKTGDIISVDKCIGNFELILENDPKLKGNIQTDTFAHRLCVTGPLPWIDEHHCEKFNKKDSIVTQKFPWEDRDFNFLQSYISRNYCNLENKNNLLTALFNVANKNSFNDVKIYLKNLHWDGKPRLDTLFIDWLGAEDTEYVRKITRRTFLAAVTRVMTHDLIKWDYCPILQSAEQGLGKSTLIQRMGNIDYGWFTDSVNDFSKGRKDIMEKIMGKWIAELGEMSALSRSEVNDVKTVLSALEDSDRLSYDRWRTDMRRTCIFIGTSNENAMLKDQTGNRRFLMIKCSKKRRKHNVLKEFTQDIVDQIWAEVVELFNKGTEELYVTDDIEDEAKKLQEEFRDKNPIEGVIKEFLEKPIPENWYQDQGLNNMRAWFQDPQDFGMHNANDGYNEKYKNAVKRDKVCVAEIWVLCLGNSLSSLNGNRKASNDIVNVLRNLPGWEKCNARFGVFGNTSGYRRVQDDE